jgi:threonine dehydrogenase-like Zn-dependent dehydrogenase
MGTRMHAHRSQLRRLPDGLEPQAGVLADPLAVGAHAAEHVLGGGRADPEGMVVVLGAGTIGLAVTASLRRLGAEHVVVSAAWPYQRALVEGLGAQPIPHRPEAVVRSVATAGEGRLSRPWRGLPWLVAGGAAAVVDAVGSTATAELALAIVRPGGMVVRVGVGRAGRTQATLAYFKEVTVVGSNGYRRDDLDVALGMLARGDVAWREWLTHRFPLTAWRQAFGTAARPQEHGAVKVTLTIGAER